MFLRSCAMALAALALTTSISTSSQADSYDRYMRTPRDAFGYNAYVATQGSQGGSYGYPNGYGYGQGGYSQGNYGYGQGGYGYGQGGYGYPNGYGANGITCDRALGVCSDRYGLSYHATARYLGQREANRAYKHFGDQVFLFTPKRGVICDRRTDTCSRAGWASWDYQDQRGWNRNHNQNQGADHQR